MKNGRYFWCGCASCTLVAILVCGISVSVYYTSQERIVFRSSSGNGNNRGGDGGDAAGPSAPIGNFHERRHSNSQQKPLETSSLVLEAPDAKTTDLSNNVLGQRQQEVYKAAPAPEDELATTGGSSTSTVSPAERRWERRHSAVPPAFSPPETMYFGRKAAPVYETNTGPDALMIPSARKSSVSRWPLPPDSREVGAGVGGGAHRVDQQELGAMAGRGPEQGSAAGAMRVQDPAASRRARHQPTGESDAEANADGHAIWEMKTTSISEPVQGHQRSKRETDQVPSRDQESNNNGETDSVFGIPGMKIQGTFAAGGRKFFSIGGTDSAAPPAEILEKIAGEIENIRRAREKSPAGMGLITHAALDNEVGGSADGTYLRGKPRRVRSAPAATDDGYDPRRTYNLEEMFGDPARSRQMSPSGVFDAPSSGPRVDRDKPAGMRSALEKMLRSLPPGLSRPDVHSFGAAVGGSFNGGDQDRRQPFLQPPGLITNDGRNAESFFVSREPTAADGSGAEREFVTTTTTTATSTSRPNIITPAVDLVPTRRPSPPTRAPQTSDMEVVLFETQNQPPPALKSKEGGGKNTFDSAPAPAPGAANDEGIKETGGENKAVEVQTSGALRAAPPSSINNDLASFVSRMRSSSSLGRQRGKPPLARRPAIFGGSPGSFYDEGGPLQTSPSVFGDPSSSSSSSRIMSPDDVVRMLSRGDGLTPYSVDRGTVLRPGKILARSGFDVELNMYLPMPRRRLVVADDVAAPASADDDAAGNSVVGGGGGRPAGNL